MVDQIPASACPFRRESRFASDTAAGQLAKNEAKNRCTNCVGSGWGCQAKAPGEVSTWTAMVGSSGRDGVSAEVN